MKRTLLRIFFITAAFSVVFFSKTNAGGPTAGYTNAPSENSCATSGCHNSYSLKTSGGVHNRLKMTSNFTGNGYIPDSTYTITFSVRAGGITKYGYQVTCLDATNAPAGTFSTVDSRSQTMTKTFGTLTRQYAGHTSSGTAAVSSDSTAWKINWKAPNKNLGNLRFYFVLNATDGSGGTSGDTVYSKIFTLAPSTLLPTADIKITDPVNCSGSQLSFEATTTGSPTSYTWSFPSGSPISSTSQTPKITYNNAGTYKAILTVKNPKGTSTPDTLTFTVLQGASTPVVTPSGTNNICAGDSIQLVANFLNNHTYTWNPGGQTGRILKVKDSGVYTVTVTNNNQCTKTSLPVVIKVQPKPKAMIIGDFSGDTICSGTPFSLAAFILSGKADSFSFVSQAGPFRSIDTINRKLNSGSQTYKLWVKNAQYGCTSDEASKTVNVKQKVAGPTLTVQNIDYTEFTIAWGAVNGAIAYKVSVDSGKTYITPSSGSNGLTHKVTGMLGNESKKIMVYAELSGICATSEINSIIATTLSCTPIDFSVSSESSKVCKNGQTTILLHNLENKRIGVKINGIFRGNDTSYVVTVPGKTEFEVSVIDSNALICGYTNKTISIEEDTVYMVQTNLDNSGTKLICSPNTNADLLVSTTASNNIDTVMYFKNGTLVQKGTFTTAGNFTYSVKNGDSIWVNAKNERGCITEGFKTIINMPGLPDASFVNSNIQFDYTFTANDTMGIHKWYGKDIATQSGKSATYDFTNKAETTVTIYHDIEKNGCLNTDSLKVFVPNFASVKNTIKANVQLYPNPSSNEFFVNNEEQEILTITLYNFAGQKVHQQNLQPGLNTIGVTTLSEGTYSYKINGKLSEQFGNLIIRR